MPDDIPPEMVSAMSGLGDVQTSPTDMLIAAIKANNSSAALSLIAQFPKAVHGTDTQDGATPAHWASLFGSLDVLESLVAEDVKLDVKITSSGMQPIHWAATQGRTDVVKFLLKRGVDINSVDIKHTTPLVIAAQYDHSVLVFYLVKEGADISLLDDCSDSALHWAAYKGNLHTAALLHYLGLPADAADSYGSTPLHLAAARNAPHVIEYLIDESSSSVEQLVSAKDNKGRTPLDIARERANPWAVRLLQRAVPNLGQRLINGMMGSDGSKIMFYFYITNTAMAYAVYALFLAPVIGTVYQHYAYATACALMQITYLHINQASPGQIDTGAAARKEYEAAMLKAAEGSHDAADASSMPALCHTCRIVKPLRSKHCSTLKRCVPMFDHFCPYINNTIGGGNYIFFVRFIFMGMINTLLTVIAALQVHALYTHMHTCACPRLSHTRTSHTSSHSPTPLSHTHPFVCLSSTHTVPPNHQHPLGRDVALPHRLLRRAINGRPHEQLPSDPHTKEPHDERGHEQASIRVPTGRYEQIPQPVLERAVVQLLGVPGEEGRGPGQPVHPH